MPGEPPLARCRREPGPVLGICARGPWTLYPLVIDNLPLTREETEAPSLSVGRDRAQRELEFEPALPETGAPVLIPHLAGKPGALPLSLPQTTRPCRHLTFLLRIKFLKKKKNQIPATLGLERECCDSRGVRVRREVATWMQSRCIPCELKVLSEISSGAGTGGGDGLEEGRFERLREPRTKSQGLR